MAQSTQLKAIYTWPDGTSLAAKAQLDKHMPQVWQWLSARSFIAGDRFTWADIYYHSLLRWYERIAKVELPPPVVAYLHRLEQRPHFAIEKVN